VLAGVDGQSPMDSIPPSAYWQAGNAPVRSIIDLTSLDPLERLPARLLKNSCLSRYFRIDGTASRALGPILPRSSIAQAASVFSRPESISAMS